MIAEVIVDVLSANVDRVFDYEIPDGLDVKQGSRVAVPFANRSVEGFVIATKSCSSFEGNLKQVRALLDEVPALTEETLDLAKYMARKYHILLAEALRLFIPAEMRGGRISEKTVAMVRLSEGHTLAELKAELRKGSVSQEKILDYLSENGDCSTAELNERFSGLKSLEKKGLVEIYTQSLNREPYHEVSGSGKVVELNDVQRQVCEQILAQQGGRFLLHGVTGSGKTEVYIRCIHECLKLGNSAIMLVPEIGLTPQVVRRFRAEFGGQVAILHSGLSKGERFDEWWRIRRGAARVVVGARSAVFAPVDDLGLLIIDEEHEQSYNSESSPRYRTEEVAAFRTARHGATLLLGSATPLVETYYRASQGEFRLLEMAERANHAELPEVVTVDMRREIRQGNNSIFSQELSDRLEQVLSRGEQALLFINRRGYSPVVVCSECGYVAKCADCDVTLTYHRDEELLKCHYCGGKYRMLTECPECGSKHIRQNGLGTQRVVEQLRELFPKARILRMDNDTTQNKDAHLTITTKFANREADILVGTQMIAKGHDFPNVTLVGILDADLSLYFSDYRANERTFSLITQVSGRAGRGYLKGSVVLQTHTPNHPILKLARDGDYRSFYDYEISVRRATFFPPFATVLRVMVSSENDDEAVECLKRVFAPVMELKKKFPDHFLFLNKMKAPVKRIMKRFRYQILMRVYGAATEQIIGQIYDVLDGVNGKFVSAYLEINPASMY